MSLELLLVLLFLIFIVFYINSLQTSRHQLHQCHEHFDDHVNYERQERAGPMDQSDIFIKNAIDIQYPKMSTYFVPFRRFHVQIFEESDFKKQITSLRDSTEQFVLVKTRKPIGSIRIRSVPNHHWRFLQFFTVGIFLENDKSKGILLHVPEDSQSVDYKIADTSIKEQNLDWLNGSDTKVIYYTTNYYDPMLDLTM